MGLQNACFKYDMYGIKELNPKLNALFNFFMLHKTQQWSLSTKAISLFIYWLLFKPSYINSVEK